MSAALLLAALLAAPAFAADAPAAAPDASAARKPAKKKIAKRALKKKALGGVKSGDLSRVDAESGAAIAGLEKRLHAAAGDGSAGVTPGMTDDIRATLNQTQGGVSPDMNELLNAVSHDGGKLSPQTMQKLQGAGRDANAEGLDLNIDPNVRKALLEGDFGKDPAADGAPAD